MKNLLIVSVLLLGGSGSLMASQAQQMAAGLEADAVEKLVDSYKQQHFNEISRDKFDAMHLADISVNKFLSGKMSTLVESKLEEIRKGEEVSWSQTQFIILKVKGDGPRFFVKKSVKA